MFVVNSGYHFGHQCFPCSVIPTDSLYPNLEYNEKSTQFYLSSNFSHLWTDNTRFSCGIGSVDEITGKYKVLAIVNHGASEEIRDARHFDKLPIEWLRNNMGFRSQYNPYLVGLIENSFLKEWLCAWEWDEGEESYQIRMLKSGQITEPIKVPPLKVRLEIYKQESIASTKRCCDALANDFAHKAWQDSMRRK